MARSSSIPEKSDPKNPADIILPSQYYAGLRRAGLACGEQQLMLALLADAIFCVLTGSDRRRRDEAWRWLAGRSSAVSFEQACEAVGLEPDAMKTGIEKLALTDHGRAMRKYLRRKHRSG
jgi:hypothetical protein